LGGYIKPEDSENPIVSNDPAFYRELLDHIGDGVYFVDRERRIQYWNEGAYRLTGYTAGEMLGKSCRDDLLCHVDSTGKTLCNDGCPLAATMNEGKPNQSLVFLRHKQGGRVPVSTRVQPIRGADGSIIGAIEIFNDNSAQFDEQRKLEAMNRLAFLDHLTQLPNRRFLEMTLQTALGEFEVHKDPLGVILIDIDEFKKINDSLGHAGGDRALQEAARTLTGSLRPTDIVGRWGGDEFLAIAHNVDREMLRKLAERCVGLIGQTSIQDDEQRVSLSSSVGAALSRQGESAHELVQRADELMYRSKHGGRGRATTESSDIKTP
jgi:diguanylate cyclase (GGDEF)-like protein/PAS domain S-box-containing protein